MRRNVDLHIFDTTSFNENLTVGTFLTGLVLGYKILKDNIGVKEKIQKFIRELSREEKCFYIKKRKWNLAAIAKTKSK